MSSRFVSCAVANLTRRVGGISLAKPGAATNSKPILAASFGTQRLPITNQPTPLTSSSSTLLPSSFEAENGVASSNALDQATRTMVTRKKRLARRAKRRLEAKIAALKEEGKLKEDKDATPEVAAPQHEAWVEFQKSISVGGFQTGQTTKARVQKKGESGQKLRDLKLREKLEQRIKAKRDDGDDMRGGEYPVRRFSDEETERLLKMAYASIPPRAGKRGTRNLKRQSRRWFLVRKIRAKKKRQVIAAHFRKMEKRSRIAKDTRAVFAGSVDIRANDRAYQKEVLRRWVQNLKQSSDDFAKEEMVQGESKNA